MKNKAWPKAKLDKLTNIVCMFAILSSGYGFCMDKTDMVSAFSFVTFIFIFIMHTLTMGEDTFR